MAAVFRLSQRSVRTLSRSSWSSCVRCDQTRAIWVERRIARDARPSALLDPARGLWLTVSRRTYQSMTNAQADVRDSKAATAQASARTAAVAANELVKPSKPSDDVTESKEKTDKEQRKIDLSIIRRLAVNLWPKGDTEVKLRVVGALGFLVAGKVGCLRDLRAGMR